MGRLKFGGWSWPRGKKTLQGAQGSWSVFLFSKNCGVYWTKFETISGKIRRILTNDTCASAALDKLARGKTQKFLIIFICGSPHAPRREAENLKGRKFLGLLPPLHSSKKAISVV